MVCLVRLSRKRVKSKKVIIVSSSCHSTARVSSSDAPYGLSAHIYKPYSPSASVSVCLKHTAPYGVLQCESHLAGGNLPDVEVVQLAVAHWPGWCLACTLLPLALLSSVWCLCLCDSPRIPASLTHTCHRRLRMRWLQRAPPAWRSHEAQAARVRAQPRSGRHVVLLRLRCSLLPSAPPSGRPREAVLAARPRAFARSAGRPLVRRPRARGRALAAARPENLNLNLQVLGKQ